jgi:hypothetical protein
MAGNGRNVPCPDDLTMEFGHVGAHRHALSRVLPGTLAGDAEVRSVALIAMYHRKLTPRQRMTPDKKHYHFQAEQAKRLAAEVSDPLVRDRLLEMADEYSRYALLIDARDSERQIIH